MQVSKVKGIKFPLGGQFILSFQDKSLEEVKAILGEFLHAQKSSSEKGSETILSQFNVEIYDSIWNIWSVRIISNEAIFTFRDVKFQNIIVLVIPVFIFFAHFFVSPNVGWLKAFTSSITPFLIFILFFYIGRNVVFWRICKRLKKL